jgi:hypothetical protein
MTSARAFFSALAAARPPNPPPTITTLGRWSLTSEKRLRGTGFVGSGPCEFSPGCQRQGPLSAKNTHTCLQRPTKKQLHNLYSYEGRPGRHVEVLLSPLVSNVGGARDERIVTCRFPGGCGQRTFVRPALWRALCVDDKLRILAATKKAWGDRARTVFPRQGKFANDPGWWPPIRRRTRHTRDSVSGLGFRRPARLSGWLKRGSNRVYTGLNRLDSREPGSL